MRFDYADLVLINFAEPDYVHHLNNLIFVGYPLTSNADHHDIRENNCMRLMIKTYNVLTLNVVYQQLAIIYNI